jgi:hypothetical protein
MDDDTRTLLLQLAEQEEEAEWNRAAEEEAKTFQLLDTERGEREKELSLKR